MFNFNFFFSPLVPRSEGLELLGVDERRESNLDGLVRLPAAQQLELSESDRIPDYTVVGHGTLTVRESILEEAFQLGERFVDASGGGPAGHPRAILPADAASTGRGTSPCSTSPRGSVAAPTFISGSGTRTATRSGERR